jgi:hypothetical protein
MTALLQKAFNAISELSESEQDAIATQLLAEIAKEDEFDLALQQTAEKLVPMALEALAEHRAGLTLPFPGEKE